MQLRQRGIDGRGVYSQLTYDMCWSTNLKPGPNRPPWAGYLCMRIRCAGIVVDGHWEEMENFSIRVNMAANRKPPRSAGTDSALAHEQLLNEQRVK